MQATWRIHSQTMGVTLQKEYLTVRGQVQGAMCRQREGAWRAGVWCRGAPGAVSTTVVCWDIT